MEISRRRVMLVLLFYLCGPFEALGQNVERVIMAVPGIGLSQLPAFIAQEKGFYKQERLEVLIVVMDGTIATRAMIGGDIDFNLALASGVSAILNGAPVKGVMDMTTRGRRASWLSRKSTLRRTSKGKSSVSAVLADRRITVLCSCSSISAWIPRMFPF